jgi:chromosomal replication initiator protein
MTYFSAPGIPQDIADILFKTIEFRLGVTKAQLQSQTRKRTVVIPRQVFCYLMYKTGKFSYDAIGKLVGDRDHTTVLHSVKTVEDFLEIEDPKLTEIYNKIKS